MWGGGGGRGGMKGEVGRGKGRVTNFVSVLSTAHGHLNNNRSEIYTQMYNFNVP